MDTSRPNRPLHITCSSFKPEDKELLSNLVKKIGGVWQDNLSMDTDVLVASTVNSHKYTGANIINIPIVTNKWIYESFKEQKLLPPDAYILPCFAGITIGILGFSEKEKEEIGQIIDDHGGESQTDMKKILEEKICNIIIVKQLQQRFYESCIESIDVPFVSIEWLKNCILSRKYLRTNRYLINTMSQNYKDMERRKQINNYEGHVNRILGDYECSNSTFNYLNRCVIYFHNIPDKIEKVLRKMVAAGGGFFIKTHIASVTHIVVESYSESSLLEFSKYRDVRIVNLNWLADCLIYRRKINEEDYYMHPSPNTNIVDERSRTQNTRFSIDTKFSMEGSNQLIRRSSFITNSQPTTFLRRISSQVQLPSASTDNKGRFSMGIALKAKDSVVEKGFEIVKKPSSDSVGSKNNKKPKSPLRPKGRSRRNPPKNISFILKECTFYLDPNLEDAAEVYWKKILENGGKIIDNINDFEEIYWVLSDSPDSKNKMEKNEKKHKIKFISSRWIDGSLSKKRPIDNIIEDCLLQYMPFPHKMPLEGFKDKCVFPAGFEPRRKNIFKETLTLLGAKVLYDPEQLDVLVVHKKDSKKYQEVILKHQNVHVVSESWIFQCLHAGEYIDPSQFPLE